MIDLLHLENYRENNRIEAKKALGGFPKSVWETYSAFANTMGGIILLGVIEHPDHSLHAVNLPDPDKLVKEFWQTVNDPAMVSANILSGKQVAVEEVDGNRIIVITVPRARRYDKPVYIGGNPLSGAYRRNGEGDYKCTREEVEAMLRDAALKTRDMRLTDGLDLSAIDFESVRRYRDRMKSSRPSHSWQSLGDEAFLEKCGAIGRGKDGNLHPTAAGLLAFGYGREILKEYPDYSVSYREISGNQTVENRNWCGNILDFYYFAHEKITQNTTVPLSGGNGKSIDAAPVETALSEALANCLMNADYSGKRGIEIVKSDGQFTFTNPGNFRIDLKKAKAGGVSDPRNGALVKLFNLIDVGSGTGSGLPSIFALWKKQGWLTPAIYESFDPDGITLSLTLGNAEKARGPMPIKRSEKTAARNAAIVEYLTDHASGTNADICKLLGLPSSQTQKLIDELIRADVVVADKAADGRAKTYRLKR